MYKSKSYESTGEFKEQPLQLPRAVRARRKKDEGSKAIVISPGAPAVKAYSRAGKTGGC